MNAKILDSIPVSGSFPEYHFGEHFQDKLWVEFEDRNNQIWFGCFPHKHEKEALDKILVNDQGSLALIISNGAGYLIDVERRLVLYQSEDYPTIESALHTNSPDYFIVSTFHSILILNHNGLMRKITPDFTVDGIYFTDQIEHIAIGDLYSYIYGDINVGFRLDLLTFTLSIDATIKVKRIGPMEYITVKNSDANQIESVSFLSRVWRYFQNKLY